MRMSRWLTIFIIVVSLAIIAPSDFVHSQTSSGTSEIDALNKKISEKRDKIKQLEDSIEKVKKDINSKRLQAVSLGNQLAILDNRTTQVELDIQATEEKLSTLGLEIEAFEIEIEQKEYDITRQKAMIAEFLRTIHQDGGKNYLEVLAAYENFSDFYNKVQYLETIQGDLGKSAKSLQIAKVGLEDKKNKTEERKSSYLDLKVKLDDKKADLAEQVFNKEDLLIQTRSSEQTFQTLLSNLRSQYQTIENEISSIEKDVRARLDRDQKNRLDLGEDGTFSWPTQSRYITSRFHDPDYPFRNIFEHNAIDIRASQGTPIRSAGSGYVARAKTCSLASCYSYTMLIHANGLSTLYGHMSNIVVGADQFVTRGDIIGYTGGTPGTVGAGPFVTGPHLHFEVRKNGIPVNPLNYLVQDY